MSWQAQTAVNHHSKQTNMGLFRLLLYLAECADETGLIDPAPSQPTMAEFFGVSDRTIRNRINALCNSKELKQTRVGSGPGNPSAYQICLPIPENGNPSWMQGGKMAETESGFLSTFEEFKAEIKAEILALKVEISSLKVEKVEAKGGKGGSERWNGNSCKSADDPLRSNLDPEYVYTPPNPLYELPEEQTPYYDPARDNLIQEMVSAISGEVKETMWDKNKHEFECAAVALVDKGLKPPDVKGFYTGHWQSNGHYKGKPALKSLLQEIDNYTSQPAATSWIDDIVLDYREDFEI